ncbi:sugar ABC transporter permease [Ktedonobacteria bacterium brp13]|nr:sugar ABC transporter permease [Ktedonobacteria bacterium brp13]
MAIQQRGADVQMTVLPIKSGTKTIRRARQRRSIINTVTGYLWLAPALLFFLLFTVVPIWNGLQFAFERVDLITAPRWVGWRNFQDVLSDPLFWTAWRNSILFMAYGLVFGYLTPVVLAIVVNEIRVWSGFFRLIFYLPAFIPPVAGVFLWTWIYTPNGGLANTILAFLHLPAQQFLNSPSTALPSLVVFNIWGGFGGGILLYIAALRGVPPELYDAAEIDGANILQRVWHVTLPQIRFLMLVTFILQIIGSVQVFNEPFLFTGGGPVNATTTVVMQIYSYAFTDGDFGAASALSLIMFLVLAGLSLYYFYLMRRNLGLVKN